MSISVTPIPRLIDLAAPAFTLGTANAAGSAATAVASDSTLLAFDTTLPDAIQNGQSGAAGSAGTSARRDHSHAMDILAAPALTLGTSNAAGAAETGFATNSTILAFDTILPAAIGTAAVGSATVAPRRDHVHAGTTAPVFGRVVRTAGNITTTSTSLEDVTGATITFTTGAFPVAYGVAQTYYHDANNGLTYFNIELDGTTLLHGTAGLIAYEYSALYGLNGSFSGLTAALSAGEHTILEQWKVGAGTGTLYAQATTNHMIWAFEVR